MLFLIFFLFENRHIAVETLSSPFTDPTKGKDGRVKMGKSKCDDGEKHTERDLKNMKKESKCQKKVL